MGYVARAREGVVEMTDVEEEEEDCTSVAFWDRVDTGSAKDSRVWALLMMHSMRVALVGAAPRRYRREGKAELSMASERGGEAWVEPRAESSEVER
jgi:hypothetical protein